MFHDQLLPARQGVTMVDGSLTFAATRPDDAHCIVALVGEIDMLTGPDFRACLREQLATRAKHLVLDFSRVSFFGSTGLAILLDVKGVAEQQGTELYLVNADQATRRVLDATGLGEMFGDDPPP